MAQTAIIYARVSTSTQYKKGQSIPDQIDLCKGKAASLGYEVVRVFQEAGSATEDAHSRPEFQKAVAFCLETGAAFFCFDTERFSRNQADSVLYKAKLRAAGVAIHYALQDFSDDHDGRMIEGILEILAERNVKAQGKRALIGMKSVVKNGYASNAPAPYGYRKISDPQSHHKVFAVEPSEAETVKLIYRLYADGYSLGAIASHLIATGHTGRTGRFWSSGSISRTLFHHQQFYLGHFQYGDVFQENHHESILTQEGVDAVNIARQGRRVFQRNGAVYLLQGLVHCGYCGRTMIRTQTTVRGKRYEYWHCPSKIDPTKYCPARHRNVNSAGLEAVVMEQVTQYILGGQLEQAYREFKRNASKAQEGLTAERKRLQRDLAIAVARKDNLTEAVAGGILYAHEAAEKLESARRTIQTLEAEIRVLDNKPREQHHLGNSMRVLTERLKSADVHLKRQLLLEVVDGIYLVPDCVEIRFREFVPGACSP